MYAGDNGDTLPDLGPATFITNPDFQRPAVWSLGQKRLLVEPRSDIVDRLDSLEIKVIWHEKKVFLDNVNGQFT
jgi:hypothetical protein